MTCCLRYLWNGGSIVLLTAVRRLLLYFYFQWLTPYGFYDHAVCLFWLWNGLEQCSFQIHGNHSCNPWNCDLVCRSPCTPDLFQSSVSLNVCWNPPEVKVWMTSTQQWWHFLSDLGGRLLGWRESNTPALISPGGPTWRHSQELSHAHTHIYLRDIVPFLKDGHHHV